MQRVIDYTENHGNPFNKQNTPMEGVPTFLADSICFNASQLAQQVGAKAIIAFTHSGYTAVRISSHRPKSKIYAFTNNKKLLHKISMVWGIRPFYLKTYNDSDKAIHESIEMLRDKNLLTEGDCVIHVGSTPLNLQGSTNMMKVSYI